MQCGGPPGAGPAQADWFWLFALRYVRARLQAAGLKHIGFGPLKKENQDEYFCQVGGFGGQKDGCCYCIFDGEQRCLDHTVPVEQLLNPYRAPCTSQHR